MAATSTAKFLKNTIWSFISQSSTVVISLITNIILARILSPFEFGEIGIIMFFITVINVLMDAGLGGALIRLKKIADEDYSTVFIFNLGISLVFFLALIASSGIIADYYHNIKLQPLVCASSIIVLINAFNIVQNVRIYREMKLKMNLYINLVSVIISSVIGIFLAMRGFNAWSLVILNLVQVFLKTVLLWALEGGVGKLTFNKMAFKALYHYGVFVTLISFLNTAFDNVNQLLIGKFFSIKQVGYYYQAKKNQAVPFSIINLITVGVVFSHLANFQDDSKSFQKEYLKILSFFSIVTAATACLIYLVADNAVPIILGKTWLGSIIYIKLLSISSFFLLLKIFCQNICKVFNHTLRIFIWEVIAVALQAVTIVIGILTRSIFIILIGAIVSNLLAYLINAIWSWRLLGLKSSGEVTIVAKITTASVIGVLICSRFIFITTSPWINVFFIIICFAVVFFILLKILRVLDFKQLVNVYKGLRQ